MKVGMIGLGRMGQGIARRLNDAFGPIYVWNRTPDKLAQMLSAGAVAAADVRALAGCDVVVSMLVDDRAVEEVMLSGDGLAKHLKACAIHVCMSTVSDTIIGRLAAAHAANGSTLVAAPVLGRPDRAAAGQLFVIAAGDAKALDRCNPLFDQIGQRTFRVGNAPQAASVAKIAMNLMVAAVVENLSESFALAGKGGVDTAVFLELVTQTVFAAPIYHAYAPLVASKSLPEGGSTIRIFLKDVELALSLAKTVDTDLPTGRLLQKLLGDAIAAGYGDRDCTSLAVMAERSRAK